VGWWVSSLSQVQIEPSLLMVFFSGAVAITAMILPGISGSFILAEKVMPWHLPVSELLLSLLSLGAAVALVFGVHAVGEKLGKKTPVAPSSTSSGDHS